MGIDLTLIGTNDSIELDGEHYTLQTGTRGFGIPSPLLRIDPSASPPAPRTVERSATPSAISAKSTYPSPSPAPTVTTRRPCCVDWPTSSGTRFAYRPPTPTGQSGISTATTREAARRSSDRRPTTTTAAGTSSSALLNRSGRAPNRSRSVSRRAPLREDCWLARHRSRSRSCASRPHRLSEPSPSRTMATWTLRPYGSSKAPQRFSRFRSPTERASPTRPL